MRALTTNFFFESKYLTDSYIFSLNGATRETASDLLYAQQVVEAQWMHTIPLFVFAFNDKIRRWSTLYEDVKLVHPESWDVIDEAEQVLMNQRMCELCELSRDGVIPTLDSCTAEGLLALFEKEMFVVAAVGSRE